MQGDERNPDEYPAATLEDAAAAIEGVLDDPTARSVRGAWSAHRSTVSTAYGDADLLDGQEQNVIALVHRKSGDLAGMFPYHLEFDDDGSPYQVVRLPWYGDVRHPVGQLPAWAPHERPRLVQDGRGAAQSDEEPERRPNARVTPLEELEGDGGGEGA